MAKKSDDDQGSTITLMTVKDFNDKYQPGKAQWSRFGGVGEWHIGPLVETFAKGGFDPDLGVIEVCGAEILDGNRRASALVECMKRDPKAFSNIKLKVRVHPMDLSRTEKENIRLRAARGTKAWTRADYMHAAINIVLDYPGDCPESYLADSIGEDRILEQFPKAIKRDAAGNVERDAKGNRIFQNRQGPFQDAKRLAKLPVAVRSAFLKGLNGEGPAIPSRALTTLLSAWENDKKADSAAAAKAFNEADASAIGGELGGRLRPLLTSATAAGRTGGAGVMSAKDMDSTISTFAASRPAVALVSYVARKPGYASETMNRRLLALFTRLEALAVADDQARTMLTEIAVEASAAATAPPK